MWSLNTPLAAHPARAEYTLRPLPVMVGPCGVEPPSRAARRLQRQSPSEDEPRAQKRKKPPRGTGRLSLKNQLKTRPLCLVTSHIHGEMRTDLHAIASATLDERGRQRGGRL